MYALKTLPPMIIRKIASDLRATAADLEAAAKAAEQQQWERRTHLRDLRGIQLASRRAVALADEGLSLDEAAVAAVQFYRNSFPALSIDNIRFNADFEAARQRAKARDLKRMVLQRRIMMFWREGLTDDEIGPRVGRHPKTVAKIRRRAMKDMTALRTLDESIQRASNHGIKHEVGLWTLR